LISVARELFTSQGYAATTIEEITDRAGVARGALYHHFASKQGLFKAVYDAVEAEAVNRVLSAAFAERSPWGAVRAGLGVFLDVCLEPSFRRIVVLDSVSVLQWEVWSGGLEHMELGMLRNVLAPLGSTPELSGIPLEPMAHIALGAIYGAALFIARSQDLERARRDANVVLELVIQGLRAGQRLGQTDGSPAAK
jgi:AcrR family transcriptional regulator